MNLVSSITWKSVKILYFIFSFQFIDFTEKVKISNGRKFYIITISILFSYYSVNFIVKNINLNKISYLKFIIIIEMVQEQGIVLLSFLSEIFILFSSKDRISRKIDSIDEHMKLDRGIKLEFKQKMTYCYSCYIIFMVLTVYMDMSAWGYNFNTFMSVWKMKAFDLMIFKFIMITHLHLCRLCLMNDYLRKKLKSKRDNGKTDWLHDWKLYPKNIQIRHCVEDLSIFMFVYSNLCENMAFINKKFNILVSKTLMFH